MSPTKFAILVISSLIVTVGFLMIVLPMVIDDSKTKENEKKCLAIKEYKAEWYYPRCIITFKD